MGAQIRNILTTQNGKDFGKVKEEYEQALRHMENVLDFAINEEGAVYLLTNSTIPFYYIQELSLKLGDTVLLHEFSRQDWYNDTILYMQWKNGEMESIKVSDVNLEQPIGTGDKPHDYEYATFEIREDEIPAYMNKMGLYEAKDADIEEER